MYPACYFLGLTLHIHGASMRTACAPPQPAATRHNGEDQFTTRYTTATTRTPLRGATVIQNTLPDGSGLAPPACGGRPATTPTTDCCAFRAATAVLAH